MFHFVSLCRQVRIEQSLMLASSAEVVSPVEKVIAGPIHHLSIQILKVCQHKVVNARTTRLTLSTHRT